jgi:hypothetical protein
VKLEQVKSRTWFYEFDLPDGSRTSTDVPADVRPIHTSRRDKLVQIIRERVESPQDLTAVYRYRLGAFLEQCPVPAEEFRLFRGLGSAEQPE